MPEPEIFVSDVKATEAAVKEAQQDVTYKLKSEIARLEAELASVEARFTEKLEKFKAESHALVVAAFAKLGFHHREAVVKANETLGLHPQTPEDVAGPHGR